MAKQIVVTLGGKTSTFDFRKFTRASVQGKVTRRALDPQGEPCGRANVTEDGSLLLLPGMSAQGYFKKSGAPGVGEWVPPGDRVGLDPAGRPIEKVSSTLGVEQELEGPVPVEDFLDLDLASSYALDGTEVDAALKKSLDQGEIYRFNFNYRTDYEGQVGYLITGKVDGGIYCFVGSQTDPEWLQMKAAPETYEAVEEDPFSGDDDDMMDF